MIFTMGEYKTQDFSRLKGMSGFSDKALEMHLGLYDGYVKNTNKLLEELETLRQQEKTDTPSYGELKRRLGWEFDGMRLHEYYFSALGGDGKLNMDGKLALALKENFGGYDEWKKDFVATAKMRGIGWAALYADPTNGRLINFWVNEHNESHPAGARLILNLDMFEHAFLPDYGTDKAGYIEAFLKNINWEEAERRLFPVIDK
jgi:Fe-Mn family superoxide dismutase